MYLRVMAAFRQICVMMLPNCKQVSHIIFMHLHSLHIGLFILLRGFTCMLFQYGLRRTMNSVTKYRLHDFLAPSVYCTLQQFNLKCQQLDLNIRCRLFTCLKVRVLSRFLKLSTSILEHVQFRFDPRFLSQFTRFQASRMHRKCFREKSPDFKVSVRASLVSRANSQLRHISHFMLFLLPSYHICSQTSLLTCWVECGPAKGSCLNR